MKAMVAADQTSGLMRQAFRRYASGVMVITYRDARGRNFGMTATSVCSVSVDPPTVLACINRQARTHGHIVQGKRFAISMLSVDQRHIAEHCALPCSSKELPEAWIVESSDQLPVIRDALGSIQCQLSKRITANTHSILIGSVIGVELGRPGKPLLFFEGGYRAMREIGEELQWLGAGATIW